LANGVAFVQLRSAGGDVTYDVCIRISWNENFYFSSEIYLNFSWISLSVCLFHILWLWHSGLFDYKSCCNTPHVNAHQLGFNLQWCMSHDRVSLYRMIHGNRVSFYRMIHGRPWRVHHSTMMNVTWRHFDQSAKQLIVGHTTTQHVSTYAITPIIKEFIFVKIYNNSLHK